MWLLHNLINKLLIGGNDVSVEVDDINLVESYNFNLPLRNENGKKDVLVGSHFTDVRLSTPTQFIMLSTLNVSTMLS